MPGMGWTPPIPAPGFTPAYGYGMVYVPHPYEAGGSSWQAGGSSWQAHGGAGPSELEAYGAGHPGITSQDTPQILRKCQPLFTLRSHWTSSTLTWED